MPNVISIISPFLQNGNPDTLNLTPPTQLTGGGTPPGSFFPYAPGDLGASFDYNDKRYELVLNDSGATSATPTGVVAANMVAFWKDKSLRLVTNDRRMAIGGQTTNASGNFVAGIYRTAVSAGAYCCVLVKGYAIPVKSGTCTTGQIVTADTDANGPEVVGVAVGTAPGYLPVGVARAANSGGNTSCDVDVPPLA